MTERLDHAALRDLVPLLAAGLLQGPEREAVEAHLPACDECLADYRAHARIAGALAQAVPQVDPPPALRAAVLAGVSARRRSGHTRGNSWLAAAAMLLVAAGLGVLVGSLRRDVHRLEAQLRDATAAAADSRERADTAARIARDAQAPLLVLTAPDVRQINLAGQASSPGASARVFWSRSRGLVLTAANLPAPPPGRVYQLWFISGRVPVSAGLLSPPDPGGALTTTISTPVDIAAPDALAVSLEPAGGVLQPTGSIYLVGQVH
jgi:anti-sigma-K factor RskA